MQNITQIKNHYRIHPRTFPSTTLFKYEPSLPPQNSDTKQNNIMSPSSTLSLLLPLLLLLPLTTANVDETCRAAFASDYSIEYGFCTTSLRANPKSETASPEELGLIAAQLSLNNATGTRSRIKDMIKSGNYSENVKETLQDCLDEVYNSQIDLLVGAVDQFNRGNYSDTLSRLSQVRQSAYDCNDLFAEGGGDDPLTKDENDLDLIATLALFLIARFKR